MSEVYASPLIPGRGIFSFHPMPSGPSMRVFYYLPATAHAAGCPPLFVLHGLLRNAETYYEVLMATGEPERLNVVLLVPDFAEELFPKRAGYNFGNVFQKDAERYEPKSKSASPLPEMNHHSQWAFTALETCFEEFCRQSGIDYTHYNLFGHSAGSQFASRFALFMSTASSRGDLGLKFRANRIVCGNAGWYTMPDIPPKHRFPYGLGGFPAELIDRSADTAGGTEHAAAASFVQTPLLLLLGDQDTDPTKPRPEIWNNSPEASEQGPHRFARGQAFFEAGQRAADQLKVKLNWELKVVPGVAHHGGAMAAVALVMLYDPAAKGDVDVDVLSRVTIGDMA